MAENTRGERSRTSEDDNDDDDEEKSEEEEEDDVVDDDDEEVAEANGGELQITKYMLNLLVIIDF